MTELGSMMTKLAALQGLPKLQTRVNGTDRLDDFSDFGSNPGALRARSYVPTDLAADAPLVVVLHGCTQNAAGYDRGSGWSQLADELGFALLFPEQQQSNNPNLCFNWFSAADNCRDFGEAMSIRQMIAAMVAEHGIDPHRIFITGLSAGGAMASIMLATYPEVFSGGAIIAGLPFGAANSIADAFARMTGQGYPTDTQLAALIRDASSHKGPWPRISIWHGSADTTVHPANAERIMAQWSAVHGVSSEAWVDEPHPGHIRRAWRGDTSQAVIEQNIISGMGHGTPLKTFGADGCGQAGAFMIEAGVSSTRHIADFWGLGDEAAQSDFQMVESEKLPPLAWKPIFKFGTAAPNSAFPNRTSGRVKSIIENALRAAGLM